MDRIEYLKISRLQINDDLKNGYIDIEEYFRLLDINNKLLAEEKIKRLC
jgi:hypothetical protein